MVRRTGLFIAAVVALLFGSAFLVAEPPDKKEEKKDVVVTSPKEGAKVSQSEEIEGQLNTEGWPVVFVKPEVGDFPWWVQTPVEEVVKGKFSTTAQFGDAATKPGTRYRIQIVVAKSKEDAMKFERGMTRNALPAGLPRSDPVKVVRE